MFFFYGLKIIAAGLLSFSINLSYAFEEAALNSESKTEAEIIQPQLPSPSAGPRRLSSEEASEACNCEKIKKGEYNCCSEECRDICRLREAVARLSKMLSSSDQCFEKSVVNEEVASGKNIGVLKVEDFLNGVERKIRDIDDNASAAINTKCPDCHLQTKMTAEVIPQPLEDEKETCPKKFLKTHQFVETKKAELKEGEACGEDKKTEMREYFADFVRSLISGGDSEQSKKLYKECPDECSFDINKVILIDSKKCRGQMLLNVACVHKGRRKKIIALPIYDISVRYKGDLICEKKD